MTNGPRDEGDGDVLRMYLCVLFQLIGDTRRSGGLVPLYDVFRNRRRCNTLSKAAIASHRIGDSVWFRPTRISAPYSTTAEFVFCSGMCTWVRIIPHHEQNQR